MLAFFGESDRIPYQRSTGSAARRENNMNNKNNDIPIWRQGDPYPDDWPQWLRDADIEWCQVEVTKAGRVVWRAGIWLGGEWHDGHWYSGVWHDGVWRDG